MAKTRTSFKKGEIHNPNGRPPKGHSITETIKAMMDEKPEIKRALSQKILEMALKGDITAMKTLWQYMDGMPKQAMDLTTQGDKLSSISMSDFVALIVNKNETITAPDTPEEPDKLDRGSV